MVPIHNDGLYKEVKMFNRTWFPAQSQQELKISGDKKDIFGSVISVDSRSGQLRDDPDRIDTNEILCKLDQYQEKSYLPLINTRCECFKRDSHSTQSPRREETLKEILRRDSATSSSASSSEEEEDDDLTLQYVLDKLDAQRRKVGIKSQQKVLINLIKTYKGQETLQPKCIDKLIAYLHTENLAMKEAGLVLLLQCCNHGDNVKVLLDHDVLNDLELIISSRICRPVHHLALDVWGKIIEHRTLKDKWWEPIQSLLPKLWSKLTNEKQVDIKVSVLKILKTLSSMEEGASLLSNQGMPALLSIQDKNSDVKECCAEILTGLVCHGDSVKVGNLDNNGITISANLLKEGPCGPQLQSLKLLSSICETSGGHADIVNNNNIIPLVLSAMRDSKCRKVKSEAAGVLGCFLATRKPGKVKDILNQVSEYFDLCKGEATKERFFNGGHTHLQTLYPVQLKKETPASLDMVLEKLVKMTVDLMCHEGDIERNGFGQPMSIDLNPIVDTGPTRLQAISNTIAILQAVCCMPWVKYPTPPSNHSTGGSDLTALTDSVTIRLMLSHVKPQLSQTVWEGGGTSLVDLLTVYSRVFQAKNAQFISRETALLIKTGQKMTKSGLFLSEIFDEKAATLIQSLLNILLIFAVCSCGKIENPGEKKMESFKLESSSEKNIVKIPSRPKSAKANLMQTSHVSCDPKQQTRITVISDENETDQSEKSLQESHSSVSKASTSPRVKSGFSEKTFHRVLRSRPSSAKDQTGVDKSPPESQNEKEAETLRRLMRKSLFEAGIFEAITPFLLCSDVSYKVLSSQILRCLIQPLAEKILKLTSNQPSFMKASSDSKGGKTRQRPMSAVTSQERNATVTDALKKMSPSVAHVIAQALERDSPNTPLQLLPKTSSPGIPSKHQSWVAPVPQPQIHDLNVNLVVDRTVKKPKIDVMFPIAVQCRQSLLNCIGPDLLTGLFSSCREVKRHTLLLLEDVVQNGDVTLHMKLSEFGCMSKLIDFLRVNEDDELMEITALIVTRMLLASDVRLKQLFDKHGGSNLLMAMSRYTKGLLREEVAITLRTVNKASCPRGRPQSAPPRAQRDIWGKINQRWKEEDKVSEILQQWNK